VASFYELLPEIARRELAAWHLIKEFHILIITGK
jgi:hypothetical protein